jgi:hypothetical protein
MASKRFLVITFLDRLGYSKNTSLEIPIATDAAKITAYVNFVKDHTDAKVVGYSDVQQTVVSGDNLSAGTYDLVSEVMKARWKKVSDGKTIVQSIPAVRNEDVDTDEQLTSAAANDYGDALKAILDEADRMVYKGAVLVMKSGGRNLKTDDTAGV